MTKEQTTKPTVRKASRKASRKKDLFAIEVGDRIAECREWFEMTQGDLGNAIGVKPGRIQNWEGGRACPIAKLFPPLAEVFGCSTDYLLGVEDWDPSWE